MKYTILATILLALFSINSSFAHNHQSDESSAEQKSAKQHKKHKHMRGHHRDKIHKMMMQKADSNGDGKVDLNEYLQNAQTRFESMDADSDGYVTGEEMRESGKAMRKKHKEAMKAARKSYKESVQDSE